MEDNASKVENSLQAKKRVLHMSYKAHFCLYKHLRPDNPGHDWKTLADLLGFSHQEISYYACDSNPVETIIAKWERQPESTVSRLLEYLKMMERDDVIEDFQPFVDEAPTPEEYETFLPVGQSDVSPEEKITLLPSDEEYDAFICYGKGDIDFAEEVCKKLESEPYNLKICIDLRDILPVSNTTKEAVMASVISRRCKKVLIILSENFNRSEDADFQGKIALNSSPGAWQRPLIPILYKQCEIPTIYRFLYHLDYTNERAKPFFWDKLATSLGYKGPPVFKRTNSKVDVESPVLEPSDGKVMAIKTNGKTMQSALDDKGFSDTSITNGQVVVDDKKNGNIADSDEERKQKKPILNLSILKKKIKNTKPSPS